MEQDANTAVETPEAKCVSGSYFEDVAKLQGQKVAVLCARYHYRGLMTRVYADGIVLADATVVEQSGSASQETPTSEDPINGTVFISKDAIELVHQCNWVMAALPSETGYGKQQDR